MSSQSYKRFTCDRCGAEATTDDGPPPADWGRVAAWRIGGGAGIGPSQGHDDLCGDCLSGLFAWHRGEAAAAAAPALTANDIKVAVTRATAQLHAQGAETFASISEQPTSVVTGELPAAAAAGVDIRAQELVDSIVDQLRIPRAPGRTSKPQQPKSNSNV